MKDLLFAALNLTRDDIGYKGGAHNAGAGIQQITAIVYTWAGIVAVVVLVVAGFLFVTSRGDPAQMKRSKDAIRGAVVGIIVVMVAFTITQFILGRVQQ